jgi:glycosyltransferase involved in cell wall biosynthesis
MLIERVKNMQKIEEQKFNIFLDKLENLERLIYRNSNSTSLIDSNFKDLNNFKFCDKKKIKILFIAMLDSIHTARWLSQFKDCGKYEIHLFSAYPSGPHKLIVDEPSFVVHDHFLLKNKGEGGSDITAMIEDVIKLVNPNIIHTLEMQHSAYAVLPIKKRMGNNFPIWLYSCWGSDIKWFERFPEHKKKIVEVLNNCDALFSGDKESLRKAVDEYGFSKPMLNVPSPGGYRVDYYMSKFRVMPSRERNIVLVKGYNGWVYKPDVIFEALKKCKNEIITNKIKVVVFSGGDIQNYVDEIKNLGIEIEIFKYTDNYDEMMELYSRARMSLASSLSDGVPNSMLESMLMGCFPILSNRGSADEFINNGVNGYLLDPEDVDGYASAIRKAIMDNELLDNAMKINREIIKERLDFYKIREIVLSFYDKFI